MYRIFGILAIIGLLAGCKSDNKEVDSFLEERNYQSGERGMTGSFSPPIPPGDSFEAQLLMKDYWVMEYYVGDAKKVSSRSQKGRWFRFNPDGTFINGQWDETTGKGSWHLKRRDNKNFLYLDNIDDIQDCEWEIQGINQGQDAMTWVASQGYVDGGAIIKIISLMSQPTKKQFGIE